VASVTADDGSRTLALAAAAGDQRALEALVATHLDFVHAVCRRVIADPEGALEATQEALIALVRGIGSYDGRARFTTWLYRVATNAALMEIRRRRRVPDPVEIRVEPCATDSGPEAQTTARLDVDAALRTLPEDQRVVLVLREYEDLEYAEIAAVLDVPVGTVRSRLNRARRALLDLLGNSEVPVRIEGGEEAR
jgi:RNA polymerase sigma-70 factor, ECF subfamily